MYDDKKIKECLESLTKLEKAWLKKYPKETPLNNNWLWNKCGTIKQTLGGSMKKDLLIWTGSILLLFLTITFFSSIVIVDAGHVGVKVHLGKVNMLSLKEGFHWKAPYVQSVTQIDVRLLKASKESLAASKDLQNVTTKVEIQYSLVGSLAPLTFQKIGNELQVDEILIEPAIQESVKAVTAQYTAEHLIVKRAEVKVNINKAITAFIGNTLREKGLGLLLRISNIAITDFSFSHEFNKAIESKVKAEQEALQAKNEKVKRITQAEAGAAEKKLAASAEAFQITVRSKARANAIKREAQALKNNPALIKLRATEKWDGVLPKFSGSGVVPFIDLSKDIKK